LHGEHKVSALGAGGSVTDRDTGLHCGPGVQYEPRGFATAVAEYNRDAKGNTRGFKADIWSAGLKESF
jgi:hypothetical protein